MKKIKLFFVMIFLLMLILTGYNYTRCFADIKKSDTNQKQYRIYENKKFRFTLQIPLSWNGYYIVDESAEDYIKVNFVGSSKTSKYFTSEDPEKITGLTMFFIGNENYIRNNDFIDGSRKIGISNKINYYYFTSTDYLIGVLYDVFNDPNIKDKEEKKHAYSDFIKAKQMEKDIDGILKTFKAK
jgi:hypothetical protein